MAGKEEQIMRKLDLIMDVLTGIDANIAVLRSRVSAVELGQIEQAKSVRGPFAHQDYGN